MLAERLLCDFKWDCLHGEDELSCEKSNCSMMEFTCYNGQCIPLEHRCDLSFECWDKSDEMDCLSVKCPTGNRKCTESGQCVPQEWWCDYYIDCPDGSDEDSCDTHNRECKEGEFRCDSGQCISAELRCYKSGIERSGCADGSHLLNCANWTCPENVFKCWNGPCLNISLRCNNNIDCKDSWIDEDGCSFQCSAEPLCECLNTKINCTGLGLKAFPSEIEPQINRFYMANNFLNNTLNENSFVKLDRLLFLDLSNNSISWLPPMMFRFLWQLHILNLQNNTITIIGNSTFFGLPNLGTLHLQGNRIETLEPMAFYGLSSLKTLDLKNQKIVNISKGAFTGLRNLVALDMSNNNIMYLIDGTLIGMPRLETLTTDEFRFCCLAKHVNVCYPPPDEFSSCEDLMSNLVLRICVWVLGVLATLGNILVIAWRIRFRHTNRVHSFLITNLAIGDLFMGTYLLIIASVDAHYRGVYSIHDREWRSSGLCSLAGFISTFSSELSVYTLTVITLDRFLVIRFPFRVRTMKMAKTRMLMAAGWVGAGFLSLLPLFQISYFKNFYGRSGVCLALHITPQKPNGWEYSVFVFLFLNLVSFSVIALGYLSMYMIARTTQQAAQKDQKTPESVTMARRMTLIVITDAACWMPIILLGLLSLGGITVPPQVFAWVAVFVLPLNAAVNPILYTISTAPFIGPARTGLRTVRRSWRLSLSTDQFRTYSSTMGSIRGHHCSHSEAESNVGTNCYLQNGNNIRLQHRNECNYSEEDPDADVKSDHLFPLKKKKGHMSHHKHRQCHLRSSNKRTVPADPFTSDGINSSHNSFLQTNVPSHSEIMPLRHFSLEK